MTDKRWKAVERDIAARMNAILSGVGNFTPIERIPLLGREGPDLTINETGLVINVKSRSTIPERLFPKKNEIKFMQDCRCSRLEDLIFIADKAYWVNAAWTGEKHWKQLADWYQLMDKWTKEFRPDGISCIIIHRPRMPIGHAGVVIHHKDLRRLSCNLKQQSK